MNYLKNKWYKFNPQKGSRQARPPERKDVLVLIECINDYTPRALVVGYRRDAAGDKQSPTFITPGIGGKVLAWNDCFDDDNIFPTKISLEIERV